VLRLLKAEPNLKMRTAFTTIYAAGLRVSEVVALTIKDIDSARKVIHVRQGLPADVRPPLEKALAEATEYFNAIAKTENEEALEEIRKSGKVQVYPLTPDERKSWLQAVLPVHKEMEKRIGKDVIDALYKVVDFRPDA
jgi:integrase